MRFEVSGVVPAPKGSYRAINVGGRAIMVPSGDDKRKRDLRSWDQAVKQAATLAAGNPAGPVFVGVAVRVIVTFRLPRPAGHWSKSAKHEGALAKNAPEWPMTKPDLDKLERATFDSMTGIVYDDDSRIVSKTVEKVYAAPGHEGASISVESI